MLAWLDGEGPAATSVDEVVRDRPLMSWINLAEVYYRVMREHGLPEADLVCGRLARLLDLDEATPGRTLEAARVRGRHAIALADCFAVATARAHGAVLVTGDPEILDTPGLDVVTWDLRAAL